LASDEAGDVDRDPLCRHGPSASGEIPCRRTHSAHVFSRPGAGAEYQPGNGDSFLFVKDVGGGEFFQLYRYDFATGDITLLTDGKSRNTGPRWSYQETALHTVPRNERGAMWTSGGQSRRSGERTHGFANGGRRVEVSDWSPDGKQLLATNGVSRRELCVADRLSQRARRIC